MKTNVRLIDFYSSEFTIRRLPFEAGLLSKLREENNTTNSFFRSGEFIYSARMEESSPEIGAAVALKIEDNMEVVSSLVKHTFFRRFRHSFPTIVPLDFYPFRILSRKDSDDLVADLLPSELRARLSYKKLIEIQFRECKISDLRHLMAVATVRHQWVFPSNCEELVREGMNLVGMPVLHTQPLPGLTGILAPDETLIGNVLKVDNGIAIISTPNETVQLPLNELHLSRSRSNIDRFLEFHVGEHQTQQIMASLREKMAQSNSAEQSFDEAEQMGKQLAKLIYENYDGFKFAIRNDSYEPATSLRLSEPVFVFSPTPGRSHKSVGVGLVDYGPYDQSRFSIKHPSVIVICHKSSRGAIAGFLGKLKSGVPTSQNFKTGMVGKYRLSDMSFQIEEITGSSPDDYEDAFRRNRLADPDQHYDLAIIETQESFKRLPPNESPYYRMKSSLMMNDVPVQFVDISKVRNDRILPYYCDTIGLQIYAKLGGTPWVLPASNNVDHEIIIGLGTSVIRSSQFAGNVQDRYVGIATFFLGDGRYILSNKCRDVAYDEYFDELLSSLRSSINVISAEYGWKLGDTVRVVYHVFKPIKNIEADVIDQLMREFPNYQIRYAFVTVGDNHPYLLLEGNRGNVRGAGRGANWQIDDYSCLLQVTSPKMIMGKERRDMPVLIKVHPRSTYMDLQYLVQQVYAFTNLSWRGFLATHQPVTIQYGGYIAKLLAHLRQIPTWNSDRVNGPIKFKKWFL